MAAPVDQVRGHGQANCTTFVVLDGRAGPSARIRHGLVAALVPKSERQQGLYWMCWRDRARPPHKQGWSGFGSRGSEAVRCLGAGQDERHGFGTG